MVRVLIVDDSPLELQLASRLVERRPEWLLSFASSGGEALAQMAREIPDVVLSDLKLLGMDGLELLKEIRERYSQVPVVIHAGSVCEEGPVARVFARPVHPYTATLLDAVPEPRAGWLDEVTRLRRGGADAAGAVGPHGCSFFPRCSRGIAGTCDRLPPPVVVAASGHAARCHHPLTEGVASP